VRLVIAVFTLLLALPAAARAEMRVEWQRWTNDPVVTFTSDDPVECSQDDVAYAPCTSPWRPVVSDERKYSIFVRSAGVTTSGTFTLDRTAPQIVFTGEPAQSGRSVTYAFTVNEAHPDGEPACTWDGAATPCGSAIDNVADGSHTLAVRVVDVAGNATTASRTVIVATPQVTHVDAKPEGGVLSTTASSPSAKLSSTHTRRWTRLRSLTLRDVEIGTVVKATCKGTGCPKRALRLTAAKSTVSLAGLTGRKLSPGTVIRITLTAHGKLTRTFTIKIRATRAPQIS
jgi:hypothetical protein